MTERIVTLFLSEKCSLKCALARPGTSQKLCLSGAHHASFDVGSPYRYSYKNMPKIHPKERERREEEDRQRELLLNKMARNGDESYEEDSVEEVDDGK